MGNEVITTVEQTFSIVPDQGDISKMPPENVKMVVTKTETPAPVVTETVTTIDDLKNQIELRNQWILDADREIDERTIKIAAWLQETADIEQQITQFNDTINNSK